MIEVSVQEGEITMVGHAQSIVCNSASCLFQTMVASIHALTNDEIEYDIKSGESRLIYENLSDVSKTLVDSFFIGICGLAEVYPRDIFIN